MLLLLMMMTMEYLLQQEFLIWQLKMAHVYIFSRSRCRASSFYDPCMQVSTSEWCMASGLLYIHIPSKFWLASLLLGLIANWQLPFQPLSINVPQKKYKSSLTPLRHKPKRNAYTHDTREAKARLQIPCKNFTNFANVVQLRSSLNISWTNWMVQCWLV